MSSILRLPRMLFKKRLQVPGKTFADDHCDPEQPKASSFNLRKIAFKLSGYNKYGLYTDDVINYHEPIIKEALRRLPKNVLDARSFRIIRALQLDFLKVYLPKEKWVTYEQDQEYRYLWPYIQEIKSERMEIYDFGCVNYKDTDWPDGELK